LRQTRKENNNGKAMQDDLEHANGTVFGTADILFDFCGDPFRQGKRVFPVQDFRRGKALEAGILRKLKFLHGSP
jgi:hypothetical protein